MAGKIKSSYDGNLNPLNPDVPKKDSKTAHVGKEFFSGTSSSPLPTPFLSYSNTFSGTSEGSVFMSSKGDASPSHSVTTPTVSSPDLVTFPEKVEYWKSYIKQEMGVLPLIEMKEPYDWNERVMVDSFIRALHESSEELYSLYLPSTLTEYFLVKIFEFARSHNGGILPKLEMIAEGSVVNGKGMTSVYDFSCQGIDVQKLELLAQEENTYNILYFEQVPLTEEYAQFFIPFSLQLAKDNHFIYLGLKSSPEVHRRTIEKEKRELN